MSGGEVIERPWLEKVGRWFRATDRWEQHVLGCKTCDRSQPAARCGKGIRAHAEMYETYRVIKEKIGK